MAIGSSSSSGSKSDSSGFSDFQNAKAVKFDFKRRHTSRVCKWIVKGIPEKNVKAAREVYKPSLKTDKTYENADIFTNPKLDETLYAALKSVRNSSATVASIDPQEESHPLVQTDSFKLIAWKLSGVPSKSASFLRTQLPSSSRPLVRIHELLTSPLGTLGEVGVLRGIKIPCRLVYPTF